jgi:transposase
MLALSPKLRFRFYREPTDMRKGFDGLSGLISSRVGGEPLCGDFFIFVSRT